MIRVVQNSYTYDNGKGIYSLMAILRDTPYEAFNVFASHRLA